jgi:hypothetical protein
MDKFKLIIILGYFALAVVGFILVGLVTIFAVDQVDRTVNFVVLLMGVASTGAVTFYMLGSQAKKLDAVHTQVNGNLSRVTAERDSLQAQLLAVVGSAPSVEQQT